MKTLTDPFGATVDYTYDQTGRLDSVTGTGFGGTSQFINQFKYRAWGVRKQTTYGNNFTFNATYNSRLQLSHFDVTGINENGSYTFMGSDNDYFDDGRLRLATDLRGPLPNLADRAYQYDNAGRMVEAFSGPAARGEPDSEHSPFRQSYGYDTWNNMTSRANRHFDKYYSRTETFVNNRSQLQSYDAGGNVVFGSDGYVYQYDAALRATYVTNYNLSITQTYDGDGFSIKRVENYEYSNPPVAETTYYVRSSVLGGRVIREVNPQGQSSIRPVYANGQLVAFQGSSHLAWVHFSPVTGSRMTVDSYGYSSIDSELDPTGADVGATNPYVYEDYQEQRLMELMGQMANLWAGSPFGATKECMVDGLPMKCDRAVSYTMSGAAGLDPKAPSPLDLTTGMAPGATPVFIDEWEDYDDGSRPYQLPDGAWVVPALRSRNVGKFAWVTNGAMTSPQNPAPTPTPCVGSIPEAAGRAILDAADREGVDPTLLSVQWRYESGFSTNPQPNPRGEGRRLNGWDVGPLQLSTNFFNKSPFTDGLPDAFGTVAMNNSTREYEGFNGTVSDNLRAGARAFTMDILPRSRGRDWLHRNADASGKFRGPDGYRRRYNEYLRDAQADKDYLNCLRGRR